MPIIPCFSVEIKTSLPGFPEKLQKTGAAGLAKSPGSVVFFTNFGNCILCGINKCPPTTAKICKLYKINIEILFTFVYNGLVVDFPTHDPDITGEAPPSRKEI